MAKPGRKPRGFKPDITERNKWLADDFIQLIGRYYKQMRDYDKRKPVIDWDKFSDTIMAVHQSILWNGCDKPVYVTEETPEKERYRIYCYKVFTSYSIASQKSEISPIDYIDYNPDETPSEEDRKTYRDLYDDTRTMEILKYAEETSEPIAFYCFRLYYLIDKMSYSRLRQITKVKGCKNMVVEIRKRIQENIDEINDRIERRMSEFQS